MELKDEPDAERRAARVQRALGGRGRVLAVVDDVWELKLGRWVLDRLLPAERAVIVTSRKAQVCSALCGQVARLDVLSVDETLELLARLVEGAGSYEQAAREVVELAGRLPLAIKLAAALCEGEAANLPWLARKLRAPEPLGELKLEGGEEREESVERCLSLSYERLDEDGKRRFRALGALAQAPFGLGALAAVWGDDDPAVAEDAARGLAGLALLARAALPAGAPAAGPDGGAEGSEAQAAGEPVYSQHGLLRAYALTLACAAGEETETGKRQARYYVAMASADWRAGERYWAQVQHAVSRIRSWPSNEQIGHLYEVARFLDLRGRWGLYRARAEELLAAAREGGEAEAEGSLLHHLGYIASAVGQKARALEYYEQALPLLRQVGDRAEAITLNGVGLLYSALGEQARALEYYEQALPIWRQVGDRAGEAITLNGVGLLYSALGEQARALEYFEQALRIVR